MIADLRDPRAPGRSRSRGTIHARLARSRSRPQAGCRSGAAMGRETGRDAAIAEPPEGRRMSAEDRSEVRRIVLVAAHWLGDTFWALQTVPFLQGQHPGARLRLLLRPELRWLGRLWLPDAQLISARGLVSDRRREPIWRSLWLGADARAVRQAGGRIDLWIDFTRTRASDLLARLVRPRQRLGRRRQTVAAGTHLALQPWAILAPRYAQGPGWPAETRQRRPRLPRAALAQVAGGPRPAGGLARERSEESEWSAAREILLFPGAGWPEKRWPLDLWLELAHHLSEDGNDVTLLFAPREEALWRAARAALEGAPPGRPACRVTRGRELLHKLVAARAVVAHDSGAAHLAAALGVPTVALYGPTNPRICGPLGSRVRILRTRCAERPDGGQHHCHDRPARRCDRQGMRDITTADVVSALRALVGGGDRKVRCRGLRAGSA
ncbi:MAG: hypothetical protein GF330_14330 [Candidatus Eisenbacteria bacterium]|nr:hypothetical protein [Candidatus Eisenbacteria bacterium]